MKTLNYIVNINNLHFFVYNLVIPFILFTFAWKYN